MVTGSRELIREMIRRLVLETVINDGPLSRAAISKKLGLTKATISAIVQDLLEEHYIEEIGSDQTQYGRKPILLRFCRQNGYIIALDLGVERTVLMVCDLLGQNCRLHQYNCPLERDTSIDFLLQLIRNQIRLLPATSFGVVGIGIGMLTGGYIAEISTFDKAYLFGACLTVVSAIYFKIKVTPHYHKNKLR